MPETGSSPVSPITKPPVDAGVSQQAGAERAIPEGDWRFMCHLCFQALPGPGARCNSGLHVGPGEGNPFNGRAIPADGRVWLPDKALARASEPQLPRDAAREAMYDAGCAAVSEEWEQLGWDADVTRTFVKVIIDEAQVAVAASPGREEAREAAHDAYHDHNEVCACRQVGHLTAHIADAVCGVLAAAPEPREVKRLEAIVADLIEGQDAEVGTPHWYALRNARAALRDAASLRGSR